MLPIPPRKTLLESAADCSPSVAHTVPATSRKTVLESVADCSLQSAARAVSLVPPCKTLLWNSWQIVPCGKLVRYLHPRAKLLWNPRQIALSRQLVQFLHPLEKQSLNSWQIAPPNRQLVQFNPYPTQTPSGIRCRLLLLVGSCVPLSISATFSQRHTLVCGAFVLFTRHCHQ